MDRPTGYFNVARYLQSTSAPRFVEFKYGGFFCGYEEVSDKAFIINLLTLHVANVTREGNRIVSIIETGSVWGRSPDDLRSICENDAPAGSGTNGQGDAVAERALILGLEDYVTGAIANLVVQGPDGRAAIGRLCNLCGRHPGALDGIVVKLTTLKQTGPTGYPIKVPELSVVAQKGCYRRAPVDDDIPF
jgi:hypothetical protein